MSTEDALIRGAVNAAKEIYGALLRAGAITTTKPEIVQELAGIIVKSIAIEIRADQLGRSDESAH